jgi:cell shape-determining protein MreC
MQNSGAWLSIIDYANFKNVSISTVRRHIKAKKVNSKQVDGKYFIYLEQPIQDNQKQTESLRNKFEIEQLKMRIRILEEENNDLRMLVNLYESSKKQAPAELPQIPMS